MPTGAQYTESIHLRMSPSMLKEVREAAQILDRSVSSYIRRAIGLALKHGLETIELAYNEARLDILSPMQD